jgi:hypothetical protein
MDALAAIDRDDSNSGRQRRASLLGVDRHRPSLLRSGGETRLPGSPPLVWIQSPECAKGDVNVRLGRPATGQRPTSSRSTLFDDVRGARSSIGVARTSLGPAVVGRRAGAAAAGPL